MIAIILPTDRLWIVALSMDACYAVKKIEREADAHRRMPSLRSPEEAIRDAEN